MQRCQMDKQSCHNPHTANGWQKENYLSLIDSSLVSPFALGEICTIYGHEVVKLNFICQTVVVYGYDFTGLVKLQKYCIFHFINMHYYSNKCNGTFAYFCF